MDTRLSTALTHWTGRMLANGVPYSDYETVREEVVRWRDWCGAWLRRARGHEALGDEAAAEGHMRSAAEHWTRAAACAHFGRFLYFEDLGTAFEAGECAVSCRTKALPHLDPPGERVEVPFQDTVLPGNLRIPAADRPVPLVLMVMGLDSTKEEMHFHEQDFLSRGLATFSFDGPGQGETEHELPIRPDYEHPVAAVLDVVLEDDRLDTQRVGIWGVSLGGYYAPRAAAFEERITACVSLSGPFDFGAAWDRLPDLTRTAFQFRSHSPNEARARDRAEELNLRGIAERITCPLLVVSGRKDRLFGPEHAQVLVNSTGGEADHLDIAEGSHVVNNLPHRYRPQTADWLADHLAAR